MQRLPYNIDDATSPNISADGKQFIFINESKPTQQLVVASTTNSRQRTLLRGELTGAIWDTDYASVIFSRRVNGKVQIARVSVKDSKVQVLLDDLPELKKTPTLIPSAKRAQAGITGMSLSPDGSRLMFTHSNGEQSVRYWLDRSGNMPKPIQWARLNPIWLTNDTILSLTTQTDTELAIGNLSEKEKTLVNDDQIRSFLGIAVSADKQTAVYASQTSEGKIYVLTAINLVDGTRQVLDLGGQSVVQPSFQP